ncbi:MAG: secondary thiamine-phosphate synthase enzyme YjbQ [Phycisphaerae bacterium]
MLATEKLSTRHRNEILDITPRVAELVTRSGIKDGLCVVFVPHTTAAVSINENADPDVKHDVTQKLAALIPERESFYQHSEGNSDSHLKTMLTGPSVTIIIDKGKLLLGTWQGIYFCEFDGPRSRSYHVKILGSVVT